MAARLAFLGLLLMSSGCVGARGYFGDRWADAKDVFTASVGTGGGVKARVGPVNAGFFLNSDRAGLRGGECFSLPDGPLAGGDADATLLFFFSDQFDLRHPPQSRSGTRASLRRVRLVGDSLAKRNKSYRCGMIPLPSPLGAFEFQRVPCYYTQVEVAVGVGGTLRLGFNPGELLDFLLGWTTLDILRDDLAARAERERRALEGGAGVPAEALRSRPDRGPGRPLEGEIPAGPPAGPRAPSGAR